MRQYLIPIDRRTIRRNPNAGATQSWLQGETMHEVLIDRYVPQSLLPKGVVMQSGQCGAHEFTRVVSRDSEALNTLLEYLNAIQCPYEFENKTPVQGYTHPPIPEFSFKYAAKQITCSECNAQFDHSELLSDTHGPDDYYTDTMCPKCGCWDACDLHYEELPRCEMQRYANANQEHDQELHDPGGCGEVNRGNTAGAGPVRSEGDPD